MVFVDFFELVAAETEAVVAVFAGIVSPHYPLTILSLLLLLLIPALLVAVILMLTPILLVALEPSSLSVTYELNDSSLVDSLFVIVERRAAAV